MTRSFARALACAALLAACAEPDLDRDASGPDADPGPADATGVARVRTPWGITTMRYEVRDGTAIAEGDIDLGPVPDAATFGAVLVDTTGRWTNGVVPYMFDPAIPAADPRRAAVAAAVAAIEAESPIHFVELPPTVCPPLNPDCFDHIWITTLTTPGLLGLSALGMVGGRQSLKLKPSVDDGVVIHELGHALGLYHEQTRADRDTYVTVNWECIDTGDEPDDGETESDLTNQYQISAGGTDFGPYDFESIMHYSSGSGLDEDWAQPPCDGQWAMTRNAGTVCPTSICLDQDGDGFREFIDAQRDYLSAGDVNALWGMYAEHLAASEAGDRFGAAIAAGDFDADGMVDVAIGAPGEQVGNVDAGGAVFVYKGTGEGFQPWLTLTQESLGGVSEVGDELGAALVSADFDDDGIADLAIGAPGEVSGAISDGGMVYVALGGEHGLAGAQHVTPGSIGASAETDDRFGVALASGDFDGDHVADLAIGAVGESVGSGPPAGRVFVLRGHAGDDLAAWDQVGQDDLGVVGNGGIGQPVPLGVPGIGDRFGWSLAAARLDSDARDDLVVGAMCDHDTVTCGGAVYVFRGAAAGLEGWRRLARPAPVAYERVGRAVAILDYDGDGDGDVFAGAPLASAGGAATAGLVLAWRLQGTSFAYGGSLDQSGYANEAGDQLGAALASVPRATIYAQAQLYAGVPGEGTDGESVHPGVVQRFVVSGAGAFAHSAVLREVPAGVEEDGDELGSGLAVAASSDGTWIFAGAPGENTGAGAVFVWRATAYVAPIQQQVLTQTTDGTHAP
jgi:hypothetical protein